jgi:hypothetical protein
MWVEAREIKDTERVEEREARFRQDTIVADITWKAGLKTNNQSTRLQPLNAIELRAFGVKCVELAGLMEDVERERKRFAEEQRREAERKPH